MLVIRAANRRFEPPPWMVECVRLREGASTVFPETREDLR